MKSLKDFNKHISNKVRNAFLLMFTNRKILKYIRSFVPFSGILLIQTVGHVSYQGYCDLFEMC